MRFNEWIRKQGTKVIVTDRVMNANRLRRKCNREQNVDTCQVTCMTLQQIAGEFLTAQMAFGGETAGISMLNAEAKVFLLDEVLREKRYAMIPEECHCIQTSEKVMQSLDQIRMNDVTDSYENSTEQKIKDLKDMIAVYEAKLQETASYDYAALLKAATLSLAEIRAEEDGRDKLLLYLPWIADCSWGILEDVEFTALEKRFLNCLLEIARTNCEVLTFYSEKEDKGHVEYGFFKAYGIVNEVRYVIEQIVEKGIPFGQVNLFYTDPVYENFIRSAFESRSISCQFVTGESAATGNLVQFMLAVLEWAENDYSYESLSNVIENPLMSFGKIIPKEKGEVDTEDKEMETILTNPLTCYNNFLRQGIGWGRIRYTECVRRVENSEKNARYKCFLEFLKDISAIFEDEADCGRLYEKLLDFTMKYTYGKSPDRKKYSTVLKEQKEILNRVATKNSLAENIDIIKETLQGLKLKSSGDNDKVSVFRIQNLEVLERPYNFVIGLSAKQFMADTTESPVLSDTELKEYLKGKVNLAGEAGWRLQENLRRTFETLEEGFIVMGYSIYNTIELKESSPSVFYLDYVDRCGVKPEEIAYCTYDVSRDAVRITSKSVNDYVKEKLSLPEEKSVSQSREVMNGIYMSSSALQTLIECPLRYYYHYVEMLPTREFPEKKEHQWLTPAAKGNLFHRTMDRYCRSVFTIGETPDAIMNMKVFEEIYEEVVAELLQEIPYSSEAIFWREKMEEKGRIQLYMQSFQKQLNAEHQSGEKWQVLSCELPFEEVGYVVKNPDGMEADLEIRFGGSIDRLDGYIDECGVLHLRIVDYKTGDMKKKKTEIKNNHQIQHYVYAMAVREYANNHSKELKEILGANYTSVKINSVQYVFPFEKSEDCVLDVTDLVEKECNSNEYRLSKSVDEILWKSLGKMVCGEVKSAQQFMTEYVVALEQTKRNGKLTMCEYCKYRRQCRRRLGTEL